MYTQQQMAPMPQQQKPSIQKLLDENSQLISLILDLQAKGRQIECLDYQRTLHRNLTYLTQFDMSQTHHPNTLPPPDAFIQSSQQPMMPIMPSTSDSMYRTQTNSPVPTNIPPSNLNKSPHTNPTNSLYPPPNTSSTQQPQQRSPAGSVPSPSPSVPMTSSVSPQNKTPTPQPPSMPQQRPYRPINGSTIDQTQSNYQQPYMSQQQAYPMQQNGYGHHPNGTMPQQPPHYPMYHQQQNPGMSVPPKSNSPSNTQQPSTSPKPSTSNSPSQTTNTQNLVSNQQQQQPMAYNNYPNANQSMYYQQQQQQWPNQPRMMQPQQYAPYPPQGQYQQAPPQT